MAITSTTGGSARPAGGTGNRPETRLTPETYTTLGTLINPTKPDNRDLLIKAYGDQGLTGFIELTGAKKSTATADEVTWWEEGRLHKTIAITSMTTAGVLTCPSGINEAVRLNDVLLLSDGQRVVVTALTNSTTITVKRLDGVATLTTTSDSAAVIGNIYAQGTDQPSRFYQNTVNKYSNPLFITKEVFIVNGSQATNIGWVNVDGSYLWYHKNEMDARKRFMNQREMMMVFGQAVASGSTIALATNAGSVPGTEGYFQAVEKRGIVADVSGGAQGTFASITDMDQIILELDKEGAPMEYAMYVDRRTSLDIDDMLASGIATQVTAGLPGQFGAFNNDANMAVQLGFKSFTRGGYTFHKHDWKMLNDATIAGLNSTGSTYKGALIPLATVADARTGEKAPALEMNYKAAGNYNRDVEHFVTGSILGYATDGEDVARFNYRSECNLVTRAANQHVIIK